MSYTAKIRAVNQEFSLADNAPLLSVHFDVLLDGEPVAERKLGFPIDATEDVITAEVKQYCVMYENDHELAKGAEERRKAESEAQVVADSLKGKEVSPDDEKSKE